MSRLRISIIAVSTAIVLVVAAFVAEDVALSRRARRVERLYRKLAEAPADQRVVAVDVPSVDAVSVSKDGSVELAFFPPPLAWKTRLNRQLYDYETYVIRVTWDPKTKARRIRLLHGSD